MRSTAIPGCTDLAAGADFSRITLTLPDVQDYGAVMAERIHKQRPTRTGDQAPNTDDDLDIGADTAAAAAAGSRLKDELDDLLDEIDNVLESNAEDFVKSYVQKGGQ